jgi:thiol:disulfide interchange protein DsbD
MSFFGFYDLKLPQGLQNSLSKVSNNQRSGSILGVAIMGCIATLIVSPCVTPALVGALGYIGKSGNALLGGSALFALGFGMGLPLLIIGTAGGKFLPKAGMWMDRVKTIFGMILLGMAIWILDRILPGPVTLLLWACLLIFCASFLGLFSFQSNSSKFNQGLGAVCFVYGVLLLIGSTMGHSNPFQPLYTAAAETNVATAASGEPAVFKQVADLKELDTALSTAKSQNKIVMLDFSANWCTSCKLMEHRTFSHPDVAKALSNFVTLKADVTDNDMVAKHLEKQYQVIAPPTLLFFDSTTGKELAEYRIVGEMGPKEFLTHLQSVLKASQ